MVNRSIPLVRKSHLLLLIVFIALVALSQNRIERRFRWPFPALNELQVSENYAGDLGALFLGAHRVAADIAYIQLLQYYGMGEEEVNAGRPKLVTPWGHQIGDDEAGVYPRLLEKATRLLRLDPYFNAAILEAAGALAFNQVRIEESLSLLQEAIQRDPAFYRYHLYVAAILYRSKGNDVELIKTLEEAMNYNDCPPLLQNILGNLLKKMGQYEKSANVFIHIIQTGKDEGQGVGYLEDGTMVVVEGGDRFLGKDKEVVVTRVFQTVAGKMIFSVPADKPRDVVRA